jgi:hypothetical protein
MRTQVVPASLRRRELTNLILAKLEATGQPVGDAVSPKEGGWQGNPNSPNSEFTPYVVLTPGPASVSAGPLGDTQSDWQLSYTLASFGVFREQCEWIADEARAAVVTLERSTVMLNGDDWAIQQARAQVIGPVQRVDQVEPSFFGQVDSISVWISKELFS